MAKRRRRRRGRRGTGNIITTRKVSGLGRLGKLGNIDKPTSFLGSFLPPLLGGGLTALATSALTSMAQKQQQEAQQQQQVAQQQAAQGQGTQGLGQAQNKQQTAHTLMEYAPALGIALGGVGAFFLGSTFGKPAGYSAAAGAIGVGGSMLIHKLVMGHKTQGWGAVVAEYGTAGLGNTGAIVMEPNSAQGYNAYSGGADVNIRGLGASGSGLAGGLGAGMDVSAFGPSSF